MTWEILGGTTANPKLNELAAKAVAASFPEVGGTVDLSDTRPDADVLGMFKSVDAAPAVSVAADLKH